MGYLRLAARALTEPVKGLCNFGCKSIISLLFIRSMINRHNSGIITLCLRDLRPRLIFEFRVANLFPPHYRLFATKGRFAV